MGKDITRTIDLYIDLYISRRGKKPPHISIDLKDFKELPKKAGLNFNSRKDVNGVEAYFYRDIELHIIKPNRRKYGKARLQQI